MVSPARCYVIAEAGVNHNGSPDLALQLAEAAARTGADAVKFQTFRADSLVARGTPRAAYQARNFGEGDQFSMLRALELPQEAYAALYRRCAELGVEFLSTPFDEDSAKMLVALGMRRIKIGSGEVTNLPLLAALARLRRPLILSTGMSTLEEVGEAVACIRKEWKDAELTLLHCTSNYPAAPEDVNLQAMVTLATSFRLPVGYSDHTLGTEVSVAAAALGARVIEKHFTLSRSAPGPDHLASLEPGDFTRMVKEIRNIEAALGSGRKEPTESERPIRDLVRRSVVLSRAAKKNDVLREADLTVLRPGTGIPPRDLGRVIGKRLTRDLDAGAVLSWDDLQ